jgi:hypothetical protein
MTMKHRGQVTFIFLQSVYILLVVDSKILISVLQKKQTKQTPWPLVRKRIIPTERPPLVDEI